MNYTATRVTIENYVKIIQSWDKDSKNELINKLKASDNEVESNKYDFSSSFGAWEDTRSAEEISHEIKNDRINYTQMDEF